MNYSQFFNMVPEVSLIATLLIVFLYDLIAVGKSRNYFQPLTCILVAINTVIAFSATCTHVTLFGGMYDAAPVQNVFKGILSLGTLLVLLQANLWLKRPETNDKQGEFYILLLSTLLGMYFMVSAGDFLIFFIGLETASIPMACLSAFDKWKHESMEAGAKYILSAMFSSALLLFGISLIYGTCGTLYFTDLAKDITEGLTYLQILALAFIISGLGFKLSLVPYHLWTADTYQGAPTIVTAYFSVISKGAAAFTMFLILAKALPAMAIAWRPMLWVIIVLSITIANVFAIRQKDLKRFMAFSSISQAGYIALGIISGSAQGMAALIFYVLVYIVANLGVFGVLNIIEQKTNGKTNMDDYDGLYQTNPKLSFIMTLSLFSLGGIPPFAGMFSKFFIFMPAFQLGPLYWGLVFIALLNTVISLYYYLLIVKAMYIKPNEHPISTFKSDGYTRLSLVICVIGIVFFGIASCIYTGLSNISFGM